MWRVARDGIATRALECVRDQAGVGAALCAMSMDDVNVRPKGVAANSQVGGKIAGAELSAHTRAKQTESEMRLQAAEPCLGQAIVGNRIADDSHSVPTPSLLGAEVTDMAKQAAYGRTQAVEYAEASRYARRLRTSARRRKRCRLAERRSPVVHPSSL